MCTAPLAIRMDNHIIFQLKGDITVAEVQKLL